MLQDHITINKKPVLTAGTLRRRCCRDQLMRLQNDDDAQEDEPMLPTSMRSPVHGSIEIDDTPIRFPTASSSRPKTSESAIRRWAKQKFACVYIILAILVLIALAVAVVAIYLVLKVKHIGNDYHDASANVGNQFRQLYEQVALLKTGRQGKFTEKDMQSIQTSLTPEQIAMAKAYGLLPNKPNQMSPGVDGLDPIVPVSTFVPQMDDPDVTAHSNQGRADENHWSKRDCTNHCKRTDMQKPPLVVISLDGFAREYLDRNLVHSFDKMMNCGSRAEFVYPSYPSKTFPNHYTMATGLYPEAHGIIDNGGYDPDLSPKFVDFKTIDNDKVAQGFFKGEPIWSFAVRNGMKMYCLFWPGCSYNITGHNPTFNIRYNKSLHYSDRVNMIVDWLQLPLGDRPSLIMAYFDQPDYVGHFHTNDNQVNLELKYLDTVLELLFSKMHEKELLECINLVFVSDHGMKFLDKRVYLNQLIDTKDMVVANGVVGRIYLANSTESAANVQHTLTCPADKLYSVFLRDSTPKRYHYSRSKHIGEIVLDGRPGTMFFEDVKEDYNITSDHGYDYLHPEMHAIFFAHGPNINPGLTLPPFQNIEFFNLFIDLMRLPHEIANNGTLGLLKPLLRNYDPIHPPKSIFLHVVAPCLPVVLFQKREVKSCVNDGICSDKAAVANTILDGCHFSQLPANFFHTEEQGYCLIDLCGLNLVSTPLEKPNRTFAAFETLTDSVADVILKSDKRIADVDGCFAIDARFDTCVLLNTSRSVDGYETTSVLANILTELNDLARIKVPLFDGFIHGPFEYLQNLTHHYASKYSRIIVITGTIYDNDADGIADKTVADSLTGIAPTHLFRILMRCENNAWNLDGHRCERVEDTKVLSFILKNEPVETNCLDPMDYLKLNTARVKDVELLTGIHFFEEPLWYSDIDSLRIRTNITQQLWPL